MQQHQIVYEALKAEMGGRLHALALQTGAQKRCATDPNGHAVRPIGSFPESHSPIGPFGGLKVGECRTI